MNVKICTFLSFFFFFFFFFFYLLHFFKTCVRIRLPPKVVVARNRMGGINECTFTFTLNFRISLLPKHWLFWILGYRSNRTKVLRISSDMWCLAPNRNVYHNFSRKLFSISSSELVQLYRFQIQTVIMDTHDMFQSIFDGFCMGVIPIKVLIL